MKSPKILLVEDNADDAELALHALKKNNISDLVFVVHDGVEALDFLFCTNQFADRNPQDLPQLILLDINLPKMNGLEVLCRVRQAQRTRCLPIVIFTTSDEKEDVAESYKRGANSYVRKPIDFTQYSELVRQLIFYWLHLNEAPIS